jgi:hypothetical protein
MRLICRIGSFCFFLLSGVGSFIKFPKKENDWKLWAATFLSFFLYVVSPFAAHAAGREDSPLLLKDLNRHPARAGFEQGISTEFLFPIPRERGNSSAGGNSWGARRRCQRLKLGWYI